MLNSRCETHSSRNNNQQSWTDHTSKSHLYTCKLHRSGAQVHLPRSILPRLLSRLAGDKYITSTTTNTGTNTHTHKWTQNCHNNQHEHKYAQTQTQINTQPTQHPTHQDLKVATTPHTAEALLSQVSEIFTIKTQISIFSFCIVFPKVPEAPAVHIDDVYITGILRYPHTHVCIKMSQEINVCSLCTGTAQRCSFYLIEK